MCYGKHILIHTHLFRVDISAGIKWEVIENPAFRYSKLNGVLWWSCESAASCMVRTEQTDRRTFDNHFGGFTSSTKWNRVWSKLKARGPSHPHQYEGEEREENLLCIVVSLSKKVRPRVVGGLRKGVGGRPAWTWRWVHSELSHPWNPSLNVCLLGCKFASCFHLSFMLPSRHLDRLLSTAFYVCPKTLHLLLTPHWGMPETRIIFCDLIQPDCT